jgi:hypothetical protein
MEAPASMSKSASSVKSTRATAREPTLAKTMFEPAVRVMPEHIPIRPPVASIVSVEVGTIIIVVIRPAVAVAIVTATCATRQNPE